MKHLDCIQFYAFMGYSFPQGVNDKAARTQTTQSCWKDG